MFLKGCVSYRTDGIIEPFHQPHFQPEALMVSSEGWQPIKKNQSNNWGSDLKMLPITHNFLLLCCTSIAPDWRSDKPVCTVVSIAARGPTPTKHSTYPSYVQIKAGRIRTRLCHYKQTEVRVVRRGSAHSIARGARSLLVFKNAKSGTMRGVWQDTAVVLIVFLCTSSSVSHYCVQTRGDVYSAETSKSPALGCNLVTSFSLLLPALLTSRPGHGLAGLLLPLKCLTPAKTRFGIKPAEINDFCEYCLPGGCCWGWYFRK